MVKGDPALLHPRPCQRPKKSHHQNPRSPRLKKTL